MLQNHVGALLKIIVDKMKSEADADFKKYGLTFTQSRVLTYLNNHNYTATQKEIEDYLCVSHPTIVGIVSRMERKNYVQCYIDQKDKRNKIISLTQKAIIKGEKMEQVTLKKEKTLLSGLTDEQIKQLKQMLLIIYKNIT